MSDEVSNAEQDKATADQVAPIQDIDLDSAALEAERRLDGEVPVETPVEESVEEPAKESTEKPVAEPPKEEVVQEGTPDAALDEPTEHKERTKLGRKVAELESNIGKLLEQNTILLQRLTTTQAPPAPEPEQEYVDLSTPEGLDKFLTQREQQRVQATQQDKVKYAVGYQTQVGDWQKEATKSEDPDVTEIHKLLIGDTPFNVRRSADPRADFEYNLSRAEAHYYKQKAKIPAPERKPPLQNETPRAPLAVGGEGKADASSGAQKPLKISATAMEFAKAQGWTDEQVAAVLSAPVSNSFVKGRR